MKPISILIPVLIFTLYPFQILAPPPPTSTTENSDLIPKICSKTLNNDLCKTILQSIPKSNELDLYNLGKIVLDIASENASNIYESVSKMQNNTSDSVIEQCLADCLENYQDAIDQIEDSITGMDFKAYNDVQTWMTAAMTDADTCEQGFKEKPGYQSPVSNMNAVFNHLCSISLAIVNMLVGV